jgi:hypothetical protein
MEANMIKKRSEHEESTGVSYRTAPCSISEHVVVHTFI